MRKDKEARAKYMRDYRKKDVNPDNVNLGSVNPPSKSDVIPDIHLLPTVIPTKANDVTPEPVLSSAYCEECGSEMEWELTKDDFLDIYAGWENITENLEDLQWQSAQAQAKKLVECLEKNSIGENYLGYRVITGVKWQELRRQVGI